WLANAGPAFSHAELASANPPVDATPQTPPTQVSISFSAGVEPRVSAREGLDDKGKRVDQGAAHTAPDNAKLLSVGLKPLTPGSYKVMWHATSADLHKTKGAYRFTFKP